MSLAIIFALVASSAAAGEGLGDLAPGSDGERIRALEEALAMMQAEYRLSRSEQAATKSELAAMNQRLVHVEDQNARLKQQQDARLTGGGASQRATTVVEADVSVSGPLVETGCELVVSCAPSPPQPIKFKTRSAETPS